MPGPMSLYNANRKAWKVEKAPEDLAARTAGLVLQTVPSLSHRLVKLINDTLNEPLEPVPGQS